MLQKRSFLILPLIVFGFFLFLTTGCEDEPALYTLTVSVSPPDGGDAEGQGDYEEGEEVLLAAVANEGYEFISWTDAEGDVLSTESDFVYMMPSEDVELTANFRHEDGTYGTVTDIDGNEYQTVYIGGRYWMAENLRTTTYADGTEIPSGLSDEEWSETVEGGFSVHPHDDVEGIDSDEEMVDAYGKLYNWYAVDDERGLCPEGWHVPTAFDFEDLINYLIDSYDNIEYHNIGNSLKSCRQQGSPLGGECDTDQHPRWDYHDTYYGTDEVGFSALPAGSRHSHGGFGENVGIHGRFWNSTDTDPAKAVRWYLEHNSGEVSMGGDVYKEAGLSVRCVKE